jgi:hypothetical protein
MAVLGLHTFSFVRVNVLLLYQYLYSKVPDVAYFIQMHSDSLESFMKIYLRKKLTSSANKLVHNSKYLTIM